MRAPGGRILNNQRAKRIWPPWGRNQSVQNENEEFSRRGAGFHLLKNENEELSRRVAGFNPFNFLLPCLFLLPAPRLAQIDRQTMEGRMIIFIYCTIIMPIYSFLKAF